MLFRSSIKIKTENELNKIVLLFEDNGIGINKENLKHIFEKFYRVPTGNLHDVKGFGIGLYYVKAMVEAHGGTITVSSKVKLGSNFKVILPLNE